ncbi:MAG: hypothetical protein AAGJ94_11685, partial [Pseudomonadota bacterium]
INPRLRLFGVDPSGPPRDPDGVGSGGTSLFGVPPKEHMKGPLVALLSFGTAETEQPSTLLHPGNQTGWGATGPPNSEHAEPL